MKTGLICYHANIQNIYPKEWIDMFRSSVLNQTYKLFDIYEICYSGAGDRIFKDSIYENKYLPTFIDAMNYLIEKCLDAGCDAVGNLNCDDFYDLKRLEIQLPFIEEGFDIVASNFCLLSGEDIIVKHEFDRLDIKRELELDHNIISHPSIVYSREFLEQNKYVPEQFPKEDLLLWKRTINDYKFKIVPENLLFHRIHNNSVCKSNNR